MRRQSFEKSISGGFLHNALQWLEIQFKASLTIIFWVFFVKTWWSTSNYSLPGWKFTYFTEIALASKHIAWLSLNFILSTSWVALYSVVCLWVRFQASVSPDQTSTFSNVYRHKSPILTLYQLIESRTVYLVEFLGNFVKDTILKMFPLICKIMFHPQICWLVPLGGNKEEGSCAKFSGSAEYREGLGQQHYRLVIIIFVIIIIVIIVSWTYSWQQKSK